MQNGARKGIWTDLMKPVVDKLSADDILNLAAYTASRGPMPDSRRSGN
jgi:cytochrome c553